MMTGLWFLIGHCKLETNAMQRDRSDEKMMESADSIRTSPFNDWDWVAATPRQIDTKEVSAIEIIDFRSVHGLIEFNLDCLYSVD